MKTSDGKSEVVGIFRDIHPKGTLGLADDEIEKFINGIGKAVTQKHGDDKLKASARFHEVVSRYKASVVCKMYAEAA